MSIAKIVGLCLLGAATALTIVYLPAASIGFMIALVLLASTGNERMRS